MAQLTYHFTDDATAAKLGGKGYALSCVTKAGFTVPDGFIISTEAFQHMTPALEVDILSHFTALSAPFVAVRSSATAEDGTGAAWAGQLDTFLNVSRSSLLDSIRRCWGSVDSERAKSYALQKQIRPGAVAVVVQRMVQSKVSGIAFSVDPVSGNPEHIVIEAGLGLGEAVVSGQITPDTYIIHKPTGELIERHIAIQTKRFIQGETGKNIWQSLGAEGGDQKLSDSRLRELAKTIQRLEGYFGYPVDVEWAIQDGKTYILQSRPITTLG